MVLFSPVPAFEIAFPVIYFVSNRTKFRNPIHLYRLATSRPVADLAKDVLRAYPALRNMGNTLLSLGESPSLSLHARSCPSSS